MFIMVDVVVKGILDNFEFLNTTARDQHRKPSSFYTVPRMGHINNNILELWYYARNGPYHLGFSSAVVPIYQSENTAIRGRIISLQAWSSCQYYI